VQYRSGADLCRSPPCGPHRREGRVLGSPRSQILGETGVARSSAGCFDFDAGDALDGTIKFDHVSHVTVSHLSVNSGQTAAVQIVGSTDVTFDAGSISEFGAGAGGLVSIDGRSSTVTISRSTFSQLTWNQNSVGVAVAAGAQHVDLASNIVSDIGGGGITATGASGVDIVGNTIQRSCGAGIALIGSATNTFVENNLIEDANPATDYTPGGAQSDCASKSFAWAPDIAVDAASASGTVSDHNDFYSYGSDNTAPYSWVGATYSTLAAFQSTSGQGTHDVTDTVEAAKLPYGGPYYGYVDAMLVAGSAAIGAADQSAPGALSDVFGYGPNPDCGRSPSPTRICWLSSR